MQWTKLAMAAVLLAGTALADQFTGWITNEKCAKAGTYTGPTQDQCLAAAEPIVFVNEADRKIYQISNPDQVKANVGKKVTLNGTLKDDKIEAESVTVITGTTDEQ